MTPGIEIEQVTAVNRELQRHFADWRSGAASVVGRGLEATVYRVETAAFGSLALKVPHTRLIENDNDRGLAAIDLLRQDALAFAQLRAHGLPAPEVVALHEGETMEFLAYRYVVTDGSTPSAQAIGRLVRRVHDTPVSNFLPVAHRGQECMTETLATLTCDRLEIVRRLGGQALPAMSLVTLRAAVAQLPTQRSLLHMDVRPANLLCVAGEITALIDWSNALIADPIIELTRMAEFGLPMTEVLAGYGSNPFAGASPAAVLAARLYTAAMLAVVFLSESPDPTAAVAAVARVRTLLEQLRDAE